MIGVNERQLTIPEMCVVIDDAKIELMRLQRRERDLETCIEMGRAALLDEVASNHERIENALRFLRLEHVL